MRVGGEGGGAFSGVCLRWAAPIWKHATCQVSLRGRSDRGHPSCPGGAARKLKRKRLELQGSWQTGQNGQHPKWYLEEPLPLGTAEKGASSKKKHSRQTSAARDGREMSLRFCWISVADHLPFCVPVLPTATLTEKLQSRNPKDAQKGRRELNQFGDTGRGRWKKKKRKSQRRAGGQVCSPHAPVASPELQERVGGSFPTLNPGIFSRKPPESREKRLVCEKNEGLQEKKRTSSPRTRRKVWCTSKTCWVYAHSSP